MGAGSPKGGRNNINARRMSSEAMFTLVVQIRKPKDSTLFEDHFWRVHLPLAKAIPGLRKIVVHRVTEARGGDSSLYGLTELHFDNRPAFEGAMASPEAENAIRDGQKLEKEAGTTMTFDYYCETTNL
jgi:uncharacterized protein (TIGR02118 family)